MRKFLTLIIVAVMLVTLVACGETENASSGKGNSVSNEKESNETEGISDDYREYLEEKGLPVYIVEAIRAYNNLSSEDEITSAMLEDVRTLEIRYLLAKNENEYYVDAAMNQSGIYSGFFGISTEERFQAECLDKIDSFIENAKNNPDEYESKMQGCSVKDLESYYDLLLRSITYRNVEEANFLDAQEIISVYPITEKYSSIVVMDSNISPAETARILKLLKICGVTNELYIPSLDLDLETLALLPNLESVYCYDEFEVVNCPENVILKNFGYDPDAANKCGDDVKFKIEDDILTIYGNGEMWDFGIDSKHSCPWYDFSKSFSTVIVEDGVTSIGAHAFQGTSVGKVVLADSVNSIGEFAFAGLSYYLWSVEAPNAELKIGDSAFSNCNFLMTFNVSSKITGIGDNAFLKCASLKIDFKIDDGLKYIGENAFAYSAIKSIEIPSSVKNIGANAFYKTSDLETIIFNGTKNEWQALGVTTEANVVTQK